MKYSKIKTCFVALFLSFFIVPMSFAAEKWILDEQHSYVVWKIEHMGFSTQTGKWYASGFILRDRSKPENSQVEAKIDLNKMITGIPELDNHLKSKEFFDVEKYPEATFTSKKIEITGQNTAKMEGELNLHGVRKLVTLMVTMNKEGPHPFTKAMSAGFSATGQIKRSDFNLAPSMQLLSDDVALEIGVEASLAKD